MFDPNIVAEIAAVLWMSFLVGVVAARIVQRASKPSPLWEVTLALAFIAAAYGTWYGIPSATPRIVLLCLAVATAATAPFVDRRLFGGGQPDG